MESEVADSLPVLIAVLDLERRYRYCNAAYRDWFGLDPQTLIGQRFEEVVGDAVYQIARPHIQRVLEGTEVNFEGTFAYQHGPTRHVNVNYAPQRDAAGQVTGYVSLTVDVSRQRDTELRLRELTSELEAKVRARTHELHQTVEALQSTVQSAPDTVLVLDAVGHILNANPPALRLFGLPTEQLIGQSLSAFLPTAHVEEFSEFFEEAKRVSPDIRSTEPRESMLRHANGALIPIEVAIGVSPRLDHFTAFIRDISRRRDLESELMRVAVDERRHIAQDLHDSLCQEISAVHFAVVALAQRLKEDRSGEAETTRKIGLMIEETLDHARHIAHGLGPVMEEGDDLVRALRRLARTTEDLCKMPCGMQSNGNFSDVNRDAGTQLYYITQEALNNVLRHAHATRMDIELSRENNEVVLRVSDNGRGFHPTGDSTGRGVRFMRYRAASVQGTLRLRKRAAGGTELECRVPVTS
ncbi:PAS domain-containing protein [Prosthecobacter sp.]|uniref:PAS domain-containing sensor histidine kinase n=1 Tax=Prosthecobacter sp. TaxID=1965333 RepID=UPI001E080750|nr:PAS domain-containing protein [Prosthecobacter sp.]MCB1278192.1 PAS domain-containing protein [Prosthecobacter sp.]